MENLFFGLTPFTQHAIEEWERMEREQRAARRAKGMQKPRTLPSLHTIHGSDFDAASPPSHVQLAATSVLQEMAVASPSSTASSPKNQHLIIPAPSPTNETFHHRHLVEKRQATILRLEKERIAAAEEAQREAERQEAARQRRLEKQYTFRIANLQRLEEQLREEKKTLENEYAKLQAGGPSHYTPLPRGALCGHRLHMTPGRRVQLLSELQLRDVYSTHGMPVPEHPPVGTEGMIIGDGSTPDTVVVQFGAQDRVEMLRCCFDRIPSPGAPSAPILLTSNGETLVLREQMVSIESVGDLAAITHSTQWAFRTNLDGSVAADPDGWEDVEYVAMIVPHSSQMVPSNFKATIAGTTVRTIVLGQADLQRLRQVVLLARLNTSAKEAPSEEKPIEPDESENLEETNITAEFESFWKTKVEATPWIDAFESDDGPFSQECIVIPLQFASRMRTIACELTYILAGRASSFDGQPLFTFTVPCEVPEQCISSSAHYDEISSFELVTGGFSAKGIHLETNPDAKFKKSNVFPGARPIYTIFTKAKPWRNHDLEIAFGPERAPRTEMSEMGCHVFAETNPSAIHTDTFVVIVTPPAPQPGEPQFRHTVCVMIDLTQESRFLDVMVAVQNFVDNLDPTDYLLLCFVDPTQQHLLWRSNESGTRYVMHEVGQPSTAAEDVSRFRESVCQRIAELYGCKWRSISSSRTSPGAPLVNALTRCAAALTSRVLLLQRKMSSLKRVADSFREIVIFTDRTLAPDSQQAIFNLLKFPENAQTRISPCVLRAVPQTDLFWRGIAARSRGHFCQALHQTERVLDMISFVTKLIRPMFTDIELHFLRTYNLEYFGGIQDLRQNSHLVICGRYNYNVPAENLNDSVGVTGRFPKGRSHRERHLCYKLGLPLTRLCQYRLLMHLATVRYMDELPSPENTDIEEVAIGSCHFNIPVAVPESFQAPSSTPRLESQENIVPPSLSSSSEPSRALLSEPSPCASLCVFQRLSRVEPEKHTFNPPFFGSPAPPIVGPGNVANWLLCNDTRVNKEIAQMGCFAVLAPFMSSSTRSGDFRSRLVQWFQGRIKEYGQAIDLLVSEEIGDREVIEEEEWSVFLSHIRGFHDKRVWISQQAVRLTVEITHVEEAARIKREAVQHEEEKAWEGFLKDTQDLRAVMLRVNRFAEEHRKRVVYAEEAARSIVVNQQVHLWSIGAKVLQSHDAEVSESDVQTLMEATDSFSQDSDAMELIACMLTVWTLVPSKAESIALFGGIKRVKMLLQHHGSNEVIVFFLLVAVCNFAQVRTTHSKLESSKVVVDVMDTLAKHTFSRRVLTAGVKCLTTLGNLSRQFRQIIIGSANGMELIQSHFSRFSADPAFCALVLQFFNVISQEATSHRSIVDASMKMLASRMIVPQCPSDAILQCFFKATGALASSRALRMLLSMQGLPTSVIITVLSGASCHSVPTLAEAVRCAEKLCGNVGDYPAVVLCTSLHTVLTRFVAEAQDRDELRTVAPHAARLLNRLKMAYGKISVSCDDMLKPLFKPWEALRISHVADASVLRSSYGAVCVATLELSGFSTEVLARIFSFHELREYIPESQIEEEENSMMMNLYNAALSVQLQDVLVNSFVCHPSQLQCLGFSLQDGMHATIYEAVPGPSLELVILQEASPFTVRAFAQLAFALLDVAAYFADCSAVHGQISPSNIFVGSNGFVVGPAAHYTQDIVSALPPEQNLFDPVLLGGLAAKTANDDIFDISGTLLFVVCRSPYENDPVEAAAALPPGLCAALQWPTLLQAPPPPGSTITAASLRENLGQWMTSFEALACSDRPISALVVEG